MGRPERISQEELFHIREMIDGCINRIMITDDLEEINKLYSSASYRLVKLYEGNYSRILEHIDKIELEQ